MRRSFGKVKGNGGGRGVFPPLQILRAAIGWLLDASGFSHGLADHMEDDLETGKEGGMEEPASLPIPEGSNVLGWTISRKAEPFFHAFLAFLSSRIFLFLTAVIGYSIFGKGGESAIEMFLRSDCGWYNVLITHGYQKVAVGHANMDAANWAFFPLFPLLSRILGDLLLGSYMGAGFIISNVSFYFFLVYFYKFYIQTTSRDKVIFATYFLSFFPYSFYFSIPYSEGLFLLLLCMVFYYSSKERWILAGILAAFLSSTRNVGVLCVFAMFIFAVRRYGIKKMLRFEGDTLYSN
ncbi:MAG: hypothetical protein ACYTHN_14405, partial [Planctomycetota bacterium]